MYEIPFLSKGVIDGGGRLHTARVIELTKVAQTLAAAGWPVDWTITGLAFDVPHEIRRGPKEEHTPAAVRQMLTALGISDEFRIGSSRSWTDLVVAKHECRDRVWYANVDHDLRNPSDFDPDFMCCCDDDDTELLELMKEPEDLYGRKELIVETDYGRGTLNGRQEALDWLFGEEWPEVEPVDEWEAEEAEMEREFIREEQAIEGFHKVLFGEQAAPAIVPDQPTVTQPVLADLAAPDDTPPAQPSKARVAEAMARLSAGKTEQQVSAQPSLN